MRNGIDRVSKEHVEHGVQNNLTVKKAAQVKSFC